MKMKLPIKQKYFDMIKNGQKYIEFRDAHITFQCIETGEELKREIHEVELRTNPGTFPDVLKEDKVVGFLLK